MISNVLVLYIIVYKKSITKKLRQEGFLRSKACLDFTFIVYGSISNQESSEHFHLSLR